MGLPGYPRDLPGSTGFFSRKLSLRVLASSHLRTIPSHHIFASYLRIISSHQIFASYLRNKISSSLLSTPKKIEACFFARSANRVKTDAPGTSPKKSVATLSRFGREFLLPCVLHMFVYINVISRHPYRCFAFLPFGRSLLMRFFAAHKRCAGMCPE